VYSRIIDGQEFTFGVSGKLIRNVLVMYDRQTGSFWSQLLGEAVQGEMLGTKLEFLPAFQTTWEDWKTTHPDTIALEKSYAGNFDPYRGYYSSQSEGVLGASQVDERIGQKEFVIGVEHLGDKVAFPFSVLSLEPIVNYQVGSTPILVVFNPDTATGVVFERRLDDGETLTFEAENGLTLVDLETGSTWDGLNGIAISGPLVGESLTRVKSTQSFWFGWYDFHPDTDVYGIPEE
jgi:hypothetical protein